MKTSKSFTQSSGGRVHLCTPCPKVHEDSEDSSTGCAELAAGTVAQVVLTWRCGRSGTTGQAYMMQVRLLPLRQ